MEMPRLLAVCAMLLAFKSHAQTPAYRLPLSAGAAPVSRTLSLRAFGASDHASGWSIAVNLARTALHSRASLLRITNEQDQVWLEARVAGAGEAEQVQFLLNTSYKTEPLTVAVPVRLLSRSTSRHFLLRYQPFRLDLFLDGVLVDQEWPVGVVSTGKSPHLEASAAVRAISIWSSALGDGTIKSTNGGAKAVASNADAILGPELHEVQYSRPRGWNTNAGDAMPFYHDGTFHLFYLFDRRQHHSKWGLGAHQWAHLSSTDLVHWKRYPIALPIDHEWEGSICTGSVFFYKGIYYAHYATRMPDHSERLGVAASRDGIHFTKTMPTPFADPAPPFLHGPNRDPSIFHEGDEFHMLVTAAVANKAMPHGEEGALEHLVSHDLQTWSTDPKPVLLTGSGVQPECSDLFHWGDWYYLLFGLSGTTHYRMSRSSTGPWITPPSDVLDGPEVKVMKEAEFKGDRRIMVGFLTHDDHYGGDLVFRELVRRKAGLLGTKVPKEMELAGTSTKRLADVHLSSTQAVAVPVLLDGNVRVAATVAVQAGSRFTIRLRSSQEEEILFDSAAGIVTWRDSAGRATNTGLDHVTTLSSNTALVLTLHGTVADLSINGDRTLIHRLTFPAKSVTLSSDGSTDVTHLMVSH